jgi:hypothetical protein
MQIFEKYTFYTDCKNAIIESYGDLEIATMKLRRSGYSDVADDILQENLCSIKEGLGDKIMNFFSKNLGGDVHKIDKILRDMKEEEVRFIKNEHESESKYYKMSAALAQLKRDKASQNEQAVIIDRLNKLAKLLKDLVRSHNSIMDELEKQVDIITKKNNRKADYYNLKRAEDSVETKKMRAEFKRKLAEEDGDAEYLAGVHKILGDPKKAQKDLEDAEKNLKKEKEIIGAGDETSKMPTEKIENVLKTYHDEILACLQDVKEYSEESLEKIKDLEEDQEMDQKDYLQMKDKFENKVNKTENVIETALGKLHTVNTRENDTVGKKENAIKVLLDIKSEVKNLNYYSWPSKDLEDQKKHIDILINKAIEETKQAA